MSRVLVVFVCFTLMVVSGIAGADDTNGRSRIIDSLTRLSSSAATLARQARSSDDRGARRKFGAAATELADELGALARRASKGAAMTAIAKDAAGASADAASLVALADEVDDKDERKSLRAQAVLLQDGVTAARHAIDSAAARGEGDGAAPSARFTGRLANTSDKCDWPANVKFVITREGRQAFASPMVFPGREQSLVLESGRYDVQILDTTGKRLGGRDLLVDREGWAFDTGCVKTD